MDIDKIIDGELRKMDVRLVLSATLFLFMAFLAYLFGTITINAMDEANLKSGAYTVSYFTGQTPGELLYNTHLIEYLLIVLSIWILLNLIQGICECIDSYKKKQHPKEVTTIRKVGLILIASGGIYLVARALIFLDQPNIKFFDISFGIISLYIILVGCILIIFAPTLNNLAHKVFAWRLRTSTEKTYQLMIIGVCILSLIACGMGIIASHDLGFCKDTNKNLVSWDDPKILRMEQKLYDYNVRDLYNCYDAVDKQTNSVCNLNGVINDSVCQLNLKCSAEFGKNQELYIINGEIHATNEGRLK